LNIAVVYLWISVADRMGWPEACGILIILPFLAYCFVPSAGFIAYLILCQAVLIAVWLKMSLTWQSRIVFLCYNAVVLLYAGYEVWWFASGQTVHFGMGYL